MGSKFLAKASEKLQLWVDRYTHTETIPNAHVCIKAFNSGRSVVTSVMLFQGYYQVAGKAQHRIQNYITMCLKNIDQFEAENHPTWGEDKFIGYILDLIQTIL